MAINSSISCSPTNRHDMVESALIKTQGSVDKNLEAN